MKCTLPSPHGRTNHRGMCLECNRLRSIAYRKRLKEQGLPTRTPSNPYSNLEPEITRALRSWK